MAFLVQNFLFFFLIFSFLRLFMNLKFFFIADQWHATVRFVFERRERGVTYRDTLNNPKFFVCSVRCMWRHHLTVTDYYSYVYVFDPTAAIDRHIDIQSIDSMYSSHHSLQKRNGKQWEFKKLLYLFCSVCAIQLIQIDFILINLLDIEWILNFNFKSIVMTRFDDVIYCVRRIDHTAIITFHLHLDARVLSASKVVPTITIYINPNVLFSMAL